MERQLEILDRVIEELKRKHEEINLEDLDVMYDLREKIENEGEAMEIEAFRFVAQPMVVKYNLPVDLNPVA